MIKTDAMTNNLEIINAAVALIIKAAILAARFSGRIQLPITVLEGCQKSSQFHYMRF